MCIDIYTDRIIIGSMENEMERLIMTRDEILSNYEVSENGTITTLGKFENEMLYVPYFWDECMNGSADYDDGDIYGIVLTDEDKQLFPELGTAGDTTYCYAILLEVSEQGFVYSRVVNRGEYERITSEDSAS